jgi:glycosyltransferase involved in cell wall biosynthesis
MSKKICAVAMVKNESDIIESFIRHTCTFCDQMVILEDRSDDNTLEIIEQLIAEGLPVEVFVNEETFGYSQSENTTMLAHLAIDRHGADLILPLDADEFLFSVAGSKTRDYLEQCAGADIYQVFQWNAWPQQAHLAKNRFVPALFPAFIVQDDYGHKCFVERAVIKNEGGVIVTGNHHVEVPGRKATGLLIGDELVLAHYPVRSVEQAMTKAIVGWANFQCVYDCEENKEMMTSGQRFFGYHWYQMYEMIKGKGTLELADLQELVLVCSPDARMEAGQGPALQALAGYNVAEIPLRYTDQGKAQRNFMKIILSNYEHIIAMWWRKYKGKM